MASTWAHNVEDAVMKMSDAERQAISRLERAIQSGDKQERIAHSRITWRRSTASPRREAWRA